VTPSFVDTHAHLDDDRFAADFQSMLERAAAAGVRQIIAIATTLASSQATTNLAAQHDALFASVGIQPNHVAEAASPDWDQIIHLVDQPRIVALGETGLDRYWDFAPFAMQEDYFARHLLLARQRRLPVVIHCREAEVDVVRMLRDDFDRNGPVRGVMHSFTGDWETAEACLQMGLFISFAGMVTYRNAEALRAVAARVPPEQLLVETDSPYLTPVPLRGKVPRNEPAFVIHTAECLARLKDVPLPVFAEQSTQNARRLFNLPEPS
jgi:TatD DNase family protein